MRNLNKTNNNRKSISVQDRVKRIFDICMKVIVSSVFMPNQNKISSSFLKLYLCRRKDGNVLFNDALNTFYLQLYGIRHMVKDHSDSEKGNPLPPHFQLAARGLLYAPSHRQDSTYHGLGYTSRGALAGTRNISVEN